MASAHATAKRDATFVFIGFSLDGGSSMIVCFKARHSTCFSVGCFQVPSNASGAGRYRRSIMESWPFGAGKQSDSLSVPGESY